MAQKISDATSKRQKPMEIKISRTQIFARTTRSTARAWRCNPYFWVFELAKARCRTRYFNLHWNQERTDELHSLTHPTRRTNTLWPRSISKTDHFKFVTCYDLPHPRALRVIAYEDFGWRGRDESRIEKFDARWEPPNPHLTLVKDLTLERDTRATQLTLTPYRRKVSIIL